MFLYFRNTEKYRSLQPPNHVGSPKNWIFSKNRQKSFYVILFWCVSVRIKFSQFCDRLYASIECARNFRQKRKRPTNDFHTRKSWRKWCKFWVCWWDASWLVELQTHSNKLTHSERTNRQSENGFCEFHHNFICLYFLKESWTISSWNCEWLQEWGKNFFYHITCEKCYISCICMLLHSGISIYKFSLIKICNYDNTMNGPDFIQMIFWCGLDHFLFWKIPSRAFFIILTRDEKRNLRFPYTKFRSRFHCMQGKRNFRFSSLILTVKTDVC